MKWPNARYIAQKTKTLNIVDLFSQRQFPRRDNSTLVFTLEMTQTSSLPVQIEKLLVYISKCTALHCANKLKEYTFTRSSFLNNRMIVCIRLCNLH